MTITSPSPNSSVYRVLSASSNSPPLPLPSSPPPPDPPFSEPNTTSPGGPPVPSAPPPLSPPSSESPPPMGSPAPPTTTPPPQASPPPTPPASNPPPSSSTPSKPSNPPPSSPQPKQSSPPPASPPPPSSNPPASPPPPAATSPPDASPPPASTTPPTPLSPSPPEPPNGALPPPGPPESSHPSPSTDRPNNSPATPSPNPPQNSRPSPGTKRPRSSPTPSVSGPPSDSTPPSFSSPGPESDSPPSPDDPSSSMPPPPIAELSPPSSLGSPPSPAGPSLVQPDAPTTNRSMTNAPNSSNSTAEGGIGTEGTVAICLTVSFLLLGVIATTTWFFLKRKKKVSGPTAGYVMPTSLGSSPQSDSALLKVQGSAANAGCGTGQDSVSSPPEPGGLGNSKCYFTYKELSEATNGFSAQYLLGEGGFGSVYKGCLADGREVAVKQLKVGGGQGDREFRAEVEIISRVHHRHLVSLVGYCISENRRLLVYDYVPNNTLHFHLHGEGKPVLGWAARVKIAVGAARGIAYLHEDCHPRIVHRDIKSSNILLDNNFEAQVSDFGLAKLFLDSNTHVTTRVVGTFGYMAPEYASSGKLTDKSDVFSFGVVLLELITGRKPVDTSQPVGEESLVEWARPLLSQALDTEEFDRLVDPRLEKCYVDNEMLLMIEAAAACVRHSSVKRPRMAQVVRAFDSMSTTDLSNGMRVGESEMFNNSAEKSAELRLFRKMAFGGSQDFSSGFYSKPSWKSEER